MASIRDVARPGRALEGLGGTSWTLARPAWAGPALLVVSAIAYAIPAHYIIWLNDPERLGAGFWPAAGVTVAILLLVPTRMWAWSLVGVGLAETIGDLVQGYPAAGIPWWTAGNVLEPLIGASLVRRFSSYHGRLLPFRNLLRFIAFAVIVAPVIAATVGTVGTAWVIGVPWSEAWPKYIAGDALGVLVVAPIILTWREPSLRLGHREWAMAAGGVLAAALVGVRDWPGALDQIVPYFVIPFLTWPALRFGIVGAAWAVFSLAQAMNVMTAFDHSPFVRFTDSAAEAVTMEQTFLLIAGCATFILAALVNELSDRAQVERLLQGLADSMPQLVWVGDDSGAIEYYNQRREAYAAPLPRGAPGDGWERIVHPDDLEGTLAQWYADTAAGRAYEYEHRLLMADGAYRWHLSRAERVQAIDRARWYGTSTDIHEMRLAEESKDHFIAIASHELRNPVAAIHGTAQLLRRAQQRGGLSDERLETYTKSLLQRTSYLSHLTDDLMDVSRLQRDLLVVNPEPTDLSALIRAVLASDEWAPGRVIDDGGPDLGTFMVDAARMRQVMSNLIDNALKYSAGTAWVRTRTVPDGVVIEVVDQGIGIPPEALERVFTPFGRAENTGMTPGLGMGLYVAREIAERHGGRLWAVANTDGPGTTMTLWLPSDLQAEVSPSAGRRSEVMEAIEAIGATVPSQETPPSP